MLKFIIVSLLLSLSLVAPADELQVRLSWQKIEKIAAGFPASQVKVRAPVKCPANLENPTSQVVYQYLKGEEYLWAEHSFKQSPEDTTNVLCIELIKPVEKFLSQSEAMSLLIGSIEAPLLPIDAGDEIPEVIKPSSTGFKSTAKKDPFPLKEVFPVNADIFKVPLSKGTKHNIELDIANPVGESSPVIRSLKPESKSIIVKEEFDNIRVFNIIGTDDRVEVENTQRFPFNTIGYALNSFGGSLYRGTAFLINPYVALTNGHVVYDTEREEWADYIEFSPAQYVDSRGSVIRPYGSQKSTDLRTFKNYIDTGSYSYDIGAVIFTTPFGHTDSFIPIVYDQQPTKVNTAGYPSTVNGKTVSGMYKDFNDIVSVTSTQVSYKNDSSGGNSGGPVWQYYSDSEERRLVAIHAFGASTGNGGPRIRSQIKNVLDGWFETRSDEAVEDQYEENDTFETSHSIKNSKGYWLDEVNGAGTLFDDDWYKIELDNMDDELIIDLTFDHGKQDIDIILYDSDGYTIDSSDSITNNEHIKISGLPAGTYHLYIYSLDVMIGATYNLRWNTKKKTVPTPKIEMEFTGDSSINIKLDSLISWSYQLQQSTDLKYWYDIGPAVIGTGAEVNWNKQINSSKVFYRVKATSLLNQESSKVTTSPFTTH